MDRSTKEKYLVRMGHNVKVLRKKAKLSQDAMAKATGYHRTHISQVERGLTNSTILSLKDLADGMQVSVADVLDGVFDSPNKQDECFCSNGDFNG